MGNLRAQGFRFVFQRNHYKWVHPAEVEASAIDCTDMTENEFEAFVASHPQATQS